MLPGVHWAFWTCRLKFYFKFGKIFAVNLLNVSFPCLFLLFFWHTDDTQVATLNAIPYFSVCAIFWSHFPLFLRVSNSNWSILNSLDSNPNQIYYWAPLMNFHLNYCSFELQNFHLVLFHNLYLTIDILYLTRLYHWTLFYFQAYFPFVLWI